MKFQIYQYQLPLIEPFITSEKKFTKRKGFLLLYSDHTCEVVSEASPLPGHSTESFDEAKTSLLLSQKKWGNYLSKNFTLDSLTYYTSTQNSPPSVSYAFSVLGLAILCERNNCLIHELLGFQKSDRLLVNAVSGLQSYEDSLAFITDKYEKGFRTFKMKTNDNIDLLYRVISKAIEKFSDIRFRIDANQNWNVDNALKNLKKLEKFPIEFIEEPIDCTQTNNVKKLISQTTVPIALDESLLKYPRPKQLINSGLFRFIVLKPTLFGSIFKLIETIKHAGNLNCACVITTALESGIARNNIAILTSFLGSTSYAHGLSTGNLFQHDVISGNWLSVSEIETSKLSWSCNFNKLDKNYLSLLETYET